MSSVLEFMDFCLLSKFILTQLFFCIVTKCHTINIQVFLLNCHISECIYARRYYLTDR